MNENPRMAPISENLQHLINHTRQRVIQRNNNLNSSFERIVSNRLKFLLSDLHSTLFTTSCFIHSAYIIISLILCISISLKTSDGEFDFDSLEASDSFILLAPLFMIVIIVIWNVFLAVHLILFSFDYIVPKIEEDFSNIHVLYFNPIFYTSIVYLYENDFIKNSFDSIFWIMIQTIYLIVFIYTINIYKYIQSKFSEISNSEILGRLYRRAQFEFLFLISSNLALLIFLCYISIDTQIDFQFLLLFKSFYILSKQIELLYQCLCLHRQNNTSVCLNEDWYVKSLNRKATLFLMNNLILLFKMLFTGFVMINTINLVLLPLFLILYFKLVFQIVIYMRNFITMRRFLFDLTSL